MNKFLKTFMVACLVLTATMSLAFAGEMGDLDDELKTTAEYVSDVVIKGQADKVEAGTASFGYNDYLRAVYCLKAGYLNEDVAEALDAALAAGVADYDESSFMGTGNGTHSYGLAIAILYLQERQADVTDYQDVNMLEKLNSTFLNETNINPYSYQMVAAVTRLTEYDWDDAVDKIKTDVLAGYKNGESGVGYDYWGISADNNGQVLTALTGFYTDEDIREKIDAAIEWTKSTADASGAIVSWGSANPDSTALALKFAAAFGSSDAATYYSALGQFKSENTAGVYTYSGRDNLFATVDALTGLLAYSNAQAGKDVFAIKNVVAAEPDPEPTPNPNEPDANVTPETTPAADDNKTENAGQESNTDNIDKAPETGDDSIVLFVLAAVSVMGIYVCASKQADKN